MSQLTEQPVAPTIAAPRRPANVLFGALLIAFPSLLMLLDRLIEYKLDHPLWKGQFLKAQIASVSDTILRLAFPLFILAAILLFRRAAKPTVVHLIALITAITFLLITAGGFVWTVLSYWRPPGSQWWFYIDITFDMALFLLQAVLAVTLWRIIWNISRQADQLWPTLATALFTLSFCAAIVFLLIEGSLNIYATHIENEMIFPPPPLARMYDKFLEWDTTFHFVRLSSLTLIWLTATTAALCVRPKNPAATSNR